MATEINTNHFKTLLTRRKVYKGQVTRLRNSLEPIGDKMVLELEDAKEKLQNLIKDYEGVQLEIELLDEQTDYGSEREEFEANCRTTLRLIALGLTPPQNSQINNIDRTLQSPSNTVLRQMNSLLPRIQIKPFDGNPLEWREFYNTFDSLVHRNEDIPAVEKFQFLKNSLHGEITTIIAGLEATEEEYHVAWELLKKKCDRPRQIVHAHLKMLLELPECTRDDPNALRTLNEQAQVRVKALKALKQPIEHWDAFLVYIITNKLDRNTRRIWDRSLENEEMPTFEKLSQFLDKQSRSDEGEVFKNNTHYTQQLDRRTRSSYNNLPFKNKIQTYVVANNNECVVCKEEHLLYTCPRFRQANVQERISIVNQNRLCFNCLEENHTLSQCRRGNCRKCNRRHNTLLHIQRNTQSGNIPTDAIHNTKEDIPRTLSIIHNAEILLGTAKVKIIDNYGQEHICRALLDGGSQTHFITRNLADKLKLRKDKINLACEGLGKNQTVAKHSVKTSIKSINNAFNASETFLVLDCITGTLPARRFDPTTINIPAGIELADPDFYLPGDVDVLLGNTLFYDVLENGKLYIDNSALIIQNTRLGWIITGSSSNQNKKIKSTVKSYTVALESQIKRFWEIEELPNKPFLSKEEALCEKHFIETTTRENDGRYVVRLPFNERKALLGASRNMALKRFYTLERRLMQNLDLKHQYSTFLKEYLALGNMAEIKSGDEGGFYLPHHPVIKESSATTKLRVVFDASAKSSTGVSLNDTLLTGPTIQDSLFSILVRFRGHVYVITADIEKMFRQFKLHNDDTKYQRILWRDSIDQSIKTFELKTVTYGTASASFLAIRALQRLADDEAHNYPQAAKIFKRDFYVDDLLTGASTLESAVSLRDEIVALAKTGGLNLRQWMSNDTRLIAGLEKSDKTTLLIDPTENRKTLGVIWNPSTDSLVYTITPFTQEKTLTKRQILSQIAKLFDPLGLLGPIIIKAKIFMQNLWKDKLNWDEPVPNHIYSAWINFAQELPLLNNFSIDRNCTFSEYDQIQLHGFCDASQTAYGACIYIRCSNLNKISVNLLCTKSRVAPLKTISLPRIELCAATLLSKLYAEVITALKDIKIHSATFWSDSTITLQWINTSPHLLKTFVANRVSTIQENTNPHNWAHVSTRENPADFVSRGQSPSEFLNNHIWLNGPSWLSDDEDTWPTTNFHPTDDIPEKRTTVTLATRLETDDLFLRYSSIIKLNRVFAYALRFVNNTRKGHKLTGELDSEEISKAHSRVLKLVQSQEFASEIHDLNKERPLHKESRLLNLNPFIDQTGLLRVGGRLKTAPIAYSQKHQILLPKGHHVTKLIISNEHLRNYHSGALATLNAVRQRYWPIDGKNTTRKTILQCVTCIKANSKIPNYIMANLPKERVSGARAFENTGIDYCGPFWIKEKKLRNRNKVKVYVAVFVCFTTKAVHLELVSDLTTEACLAAMKRFFARRGKAKNIFSDNATNFVGVKNDIIETRRFLQSDEYKHKVQTTLSNDGIKWHFTPPRSPHFGGLWEAAVKSFKKHLYKTIGQTLLTYEQFDTLIIEIEAILNSRPLTPLSSDPNDLIALTPGHFLIGEPLTTIPEQDLREIRTNRLSTWQHIQHIKQHFWSRWQQEYLQELHTRHKWHLGKANLLQEGMLVYVRDEQTAPLQWKLGRIVAVHPGDDKIIRVVTIRTAKGVYKRAIKQLVPLPISDN